MYDTKYKQAAKQQLMKMKMIYIRTAEHQKTTQQLDMQISDIPTASRLLLNGSHAKSVTTDPFSTAGTPVSGSRPERPVCSKQNT